MKKKKNLASERISPHCTRLYISVCLSVCLTPCWLVCQVHLVCTIFLQFFLEIFYNKVGNLIARMGYCHCKPMHPLFAQWGIFASINVIALKPCSCIVSNFQYFFCEIYLSLSFVWEIAHTSNDRCKPNFTGVSAMYSLLNLLNSLSFMIM